MFDLTARGVADVLFPLFFLAILGALAVGGVAMAVWFARTSLRDPEPVPQAARTHDDRGT
jgi:hypothetical protein